MNTDGGVFHMCDKGLVHRGRETVPRQLRNGGLSGEAFSAGRFSAAAGTGSGGGAASSAGTAASVGAGASASPAPSAACSFGGSAAAFCTWRDNQGYSARRHHVFGTSLLVLGRFK